MIIVTGSLTARVDTLDELTAESLAHVARSRVEDGCISHGVAIDCEDPLRLVFYERWRDRAALEAHFTQPGSAEFLAAVRRLASGAGSIETYEVTG